MTYNIIYKDIPNYEGIYQVNNKGEVKSLARKRMNGHNLKEKMIQPINGSVMTINLFKDGRMKRFKLKQLVAQAFLNYEIGSREVIGYIDGDKKNLEASNLLIGLSNRGKMNPPRKKQFKGVSKSQGFYKVRVFIDNAFILLGRLKDLGSANRMYKRAFENQGLYNGSTKAFKKELKALKK